MDERIKFFVGLDVHKDSISVAACDASREPARFVGTLGPDVNQLLKVLAKAGAPAEVSVSYEAGPTAMAVPRPTTIILAGVLPHEGMLPVSVCRPCEVSVR